MKPYVDIWKNLVSFESACQPNYIPQMMYPVLLLDKKVFIYQIIFYHVIY